MLATAANEPQTTLPSARLACTAINVIETARARTHAGAALCVPADRLANTPTHAAPAPHAPISATTVMLVDATSSVAAVHRTTPALTSALSDMRCSSRGIDNAP